MTQQHPITPPPELVEQWFAEQRGLSEASRQQIATRAAQWGADQELEACRMEIIDGDGLFYIDETSDRVRLAEDIWTTRRPKPPSLKEKALALLNAVETSDDCCTSWDFTAIRRALEQLPDHE